MIFVDHKYIGLVSARLEKFAKRKENLYTFRCPYCGDFEKGIKIGREDISTSGNQNTILSVIIVEFQSLLHTS